MATRDERIDTFIAGSADFAQPILTHLRALVHAACPDVDETIKWGCPFFMYSGKMLCMLGAFKHHCSFGFWKQDMLNDEDHIIRIADKSAGSIGPLKSLADIPKDAILKKYIKQAAALNEERTKAPVKKVVIPKDKSEQDVPDYFTKALKKNKTAEKVFNDFSYTNRKEYIVWLQDAKTEATRDKRLAQAIEWIAEGKSRNWKYKDC